MRSAQLRLGRFLAFADLSGYLGNSSVIQNLWEVARSAKVKFYLGE